MLERIACKLIVELNMAKMNSRREGGMLYSIEEDTPKHGSAGQWNGCPCFSAYFRYHSETGKIAEFRYFLSKMPEKPYKQGIFRVAVDFPRMRQMLKAGLDFDSNRYRIVSVHITSKDSETAVRRLGKTLFKFNERYGFQIPYETFVVGDAI